MAAALVVGVVLGMLLSEVLRGFREVTKVIQCDQQASGPPPMYSES